MLEPRLTYPIGGETVQNAWPKFKWATAWKMTDDKYRVEVSSGPEFSSLIFSKQWNSSDLRAAKFPLSNGEYYWRVKAFKISTGDSTQYSATGHFFVNYPYLCGDANGDDNLNLLDVTYLINYLYKFGPAPIPMEAGDVSGNGRINALDITYLIGYLYKNAPVPVCL